MSRNESINQLLNQFLNEESQDSWLDFLKMALLGITDSTISLEELIREEFNTLTFLKGATSKMLSAELSDIERNILYINADKCMRQYELKKRMVDTYRFQKSWKDVSKMELDKIGYGWLCVFLLTAYSFFNDFRFLNTCCKVLDKKVGDPSLSKKICKKIMGSYVTE